MTEAEILQSAARIVDEQDVKNVAHRFARGLDRADRAIIESCFHEDGSDDHGMFKGSAAEFCDWVMPQLENYTSTQHIISTQNAEIVGEKAVCESYFYSRHALPTEAGPMELISAGRYIDQIEKRDGVWKIKHRQAVFDWSRLVPDAAVPRSPEAAALLTQGARGKEDPSYAAFAALRS